MQSIGLVIPDLNGQYVIECDASQWGRSRGGSGGANKVSTKGDCTWFYGGSDRRATATHLP